MLEGKSLCVVCAWRMTCNKKFLMDGATTTKCLEFTQDVTLKSVSEDSESSKEDTKKSEL
jgi:hypothetical protein